MGSMQSIKAAALALLLILAPAVAHACSPRTGYVRPSNFELVQIAEAIVVATPLEAQGDDWSSVKATFQVKAVIKGQVSGGVGSQIEVQGFVLGRAQPSDPKQIAYSHPEGHGGPCNRVTLSKGETYVLFLRKQGDVYRTLSLAFSRVSEDYAGEDSLWMRAIRTYLAVQTAAPPMEQLQRLDAMRTQILADPNRTPADVAIAEDIAGHLGSISPWKPTAFLMQLYDDHLAGRPLRHPLRAPQYDEEQSGIDAAVGALLGLDRRQKSGPPDPLKERLLSALLEGDHPDAMPLFETFARPDAPPDELARAIRFYGKNGRLRDAYALIEARAAPLMETALRADVDKLGSAAGDAMETPFHGKGQPRWRRDPDIGARWPRLALKLTQITQRRFGDDLNYALFYGDALMTLLPKDYRADPELVLMLSGSDKAITDWADRELRDPKALAASDGGPSDPLLLPLRINLRWRGVIDNGDPAALAGYFCRGPAQRRTLFQEWGRFGDSWSDDALLQLAALPNLEPESRQALAEAIPAWASRRDAELSGRVLHDSPALRKLARGRPITAKDLAPLKPMQCPTS